MATINEISQFQSIRGDVAAGGGSTGAVLLDVKPLNDLAQYTFLYNREMNQRREKDAQEKAKQLAQLAAYDLNAIPKESQILRKEYNKLYDYVRNNPSVLDYKNNEEGWLEFNKKKNDFENTLISAKNRNIIFEKRQAEISATTNIAEKQRMQKALDQDIAATNINTPLPAEQMYDVTPVKVKPAPVLKFDVTKKGGNFIDTRTYALPDISSARSQANAISLGLIRDASTPTTPEEQQQFDARTNSQRLEPVLTSQEITNAISQLPVDEKGNKDFSKAPNVLLNVIEQANKVNQYLNGMREDIKSGEYEDKLGVISFGENRGLNEADYQPININDGISPEELIFMRIIAETPTASFTTKVDQTNEALNAAKLAEDARQAKASLALEWEKANDKAKADAKSGGTPKQENLLIQPALLFGEHVSRVKQAISGNKSVISYKGTDETTRKVLGLEEGKWVKYLPDGTAMINTDRNGNGGTPLTVEEQKNNFITTVRGGNKEEQSLDAKFLSESETGFNGIFGTTSGTAIWNNWSATPTQNATPSAPSAASTKRQISRSQIAQKAAAAGYTSSEYEALLKEKGVQITD